MGSLDSVRVASATEAMTTSQLSVDRMELILLLTAGNRLFGEAMDRMRWALSAEAIRDELKGLLDPAGEHPLRRVSCAREERVEMGGAMRRANTGVASIKALKSKNPLTPSGSADLIRLKRVPACP
jgi:hypothetical protein